MSIIDYQILNQLNIESAELCSLLNLNKFNIEKSLSSKTSFFTCDRLVKLYNELSKLNDNRKNLVNEEINKLFNYSIKYPIIDLNDFIKNLSFKIGMIISEEKNHFSKSIIKNEGYESLGIISNNSNFYSSSKIQICYTNLNFLIPITYFVYLPIDSNVIKSVFNIGTGVYILREMDSNLIFGDILETPIQE